MGAWKIAPQQGVKSNFTLSASHASLSNRLTQRRSRLKSRRLMADYSLLFSSLGIIVLVVDTELSFQNVIDKVST